jgi:anti-sigma-K factor RskA
MFCNQCRELISDYIDGSLELGEQMQVERHLADCEPCRAVRDDLLQIVHFSRQLPLQTPSSVVWTRIQGEVAAQHPPSVWSRLARWWDWRRTLHFDLPASQLIAAAAALVIMVGVGVVLSLRTGTTPSQNLAASQQISERDVNLLSNREIRQHEDRINQLLAEVENRKSEWNTELRVAFERNMIHIEQSLAECRHELTDHPGDDVSEEMMLSAYREKVRLLEEFSKF